MTGAEKRASIEEWLKARAVAQCRMGSASLRSPGIGTSERVEFDIGATNRPTARTGI